MYLGTKPDFHSEKYILKWYLWKKCEYWRKREMIPTEKRKSRQLRASGRIRKCGAPAVPIPAFSTDRSPAERRLRIDSIWPCQGQRRDFQWVDISQNRGNISREVRASAIQSLCTGGPRDKVDTKYRLERIKGNVDYVLRPLLKMSIGVGGNIKFLVFFGGFQLVSDCLSKLLERKWYISTILYFTFVPLNFWENIESRSLRYLKGSRQHSAYI